MNKHYDKNYYLWQKKSGQLGASLDLWKFQKFIKQKDIVLDFGCGGGQILEKLNCKRRFGIEINTTAAEEAKKRGIKIFSSIEQIPKNLKFDVIISHHSLEHIEDPSLVLKQLKHHLKPNGKVIHVVPINDWRNDKKYDKKDINKHLFTWTPLLLGNLFTHCGYKVKNVEILTHAWLPFSIHYYQFIPKSFYNLGCFIWSTITRNRQIRIIATINS